MLLPVFASQGEPIGEPQRIQIRALIGPVSTADTTTESTAPPAATTTTPTTSAAPTLPTTTAVATTTPAAATSNTPSSAAGATTTHATSAPPSAASSSQQAQPTSVAVATTDSLGQVVTSFIVSTPTLSSALPSHTSSSNDSTGGGLSTGSIVGLSVAGGIAAIGIILFAVWKFTRKRFADFDDNEAIKWPELNAHNNDVHALPTHNTGRAGFGPENDSDLNLTRAPSPGGGYANSITASVPDAYGTSDPYAVPPLPHLNPNQAYHDDPGAYGQPAGYYDPYRGPVPNAFTETISDGHVTEAIPMTQMARMRSPGPQIAYDMQGRGSPAPQAAMGYAGADERSHTPITGALGTGRASPSPYGYGPR
ncbi:hypothetical protein EV363DRAFT_1184223 [Boletus edulis]|nr:hypothetical protein EV363DRAFT_1184223 [Boletus edulis]